MAIWNAKKQEETLLLFSRGMMLIGVYFVYQAIISILDSDLNMQIEWLSTLSSIIYLLMWLWFIGRFYMAKPIEFSREHQLKDEYLKHLHQKSGLVAFYTTLLIAGALYTIKEFTLTYILFGSAIGLIIGFGLIAYGGSIQWWLFRDQLSAEEV